MTPEGGIRQHEAAIYEQIGGPKNLLSVLINRENIPWGPSDWLYGPEVLLLEFAQGLPPAGETKAMQPISLR